ncbi:MAG: hypothetical protein WCO98_07845 [bacterium]
MNSEFITGAKISCLSIIMGKGEGVTTPAITKTSANIIWMVRTNMLNMTISRAIMTWPPNLK